MELRRNPRRPRFQRPKLADKLTFTAVLPNMTTLFALCLGLSSVRFAIQGNWQWAVAAIVFAAIFDAMDGRLARYLGSESRFGAELDSLSDFISFGASPAIILYIRSMQDWNGLGWVIVLCFAICSALRLARFNTISIEGSQEKWDDRFFMGIPAPMAACLSLMPTILYLKTGWDFFLSPIINAAFIITIALGMVSKIPTFSTKKIVIPRHALVPVLIVLALLVAVLFTDPWLVLSIIGFGYILTVPFSIRAYTQSPAAAADTAPAKPKATAKKTTRATRRKKS